jgi:putative phosphoribosyl transferase
LAGALGRYRGKDTLVLGIPRGGVPVAAEVARRLDADLDVVVARKLGSPISPELAIGAVTANGGRYLNEEIIRHLGVSEAYLVQVTEEQTREARRREARFRGPHAKAPIEGRVVIVVDDGLATGATMRAAVRAVRIGQPARLVVAVPVGPIDTCAALRQESDEVVCLYELEPFWAVGLYYEHFEPVEDAEVQKILQGWHAARPRKASV